MRKTKFVITIPARNEEKTIGYVIINIHKVMKEEKYSYLIQVIDDNSFDNTSKIAKGSGAIVYRLKKHSGLAEVFRFEIKNAIKELPDIIVHIDADGQYCPQEIPLLVNAINDGYDLAIGSRFLGNIESMSLCRRVGNRLLSFLTSFLCGRKISDAQSGFRVFNKDIALLPIFSKYTYTQAQIITAIRSGFKFAEVPIHYKKRKYGKSRLIANPLMAGLRMMFDITLTILR